MTTTAALEGLVWHSLVYQSDGDLGDFAGPDQNDRCESPRHRFGEFKPPAEWVELLWYPTTSKTVARCWKTCEACHVAMAQVAETTEEAPPSATEYHDRTSGPPRPVDGPGCTPAMVEGEPLLKPLTGYDAFMYMAHQVQMVAALVAPPGEKVNALRIVRDQLTERSVAPVRTDQGHAGESH